MLSMKTPGAVLLLLWSGLVVVAAESGGLLDEATAAAPASTQQNSQPDIHTALREMSALMVEQRVELRHTKTQMETRLRASESKAETMETRLRASEKAVVDLRQTEARLTASERLVERLQSENEGVFTAPVRGVYYFAVFAHGGGHAYRPTAVALHKNDELAVVAYSQQPSLSISPSNGASLLLEVGDVVYVKLVLGAWVYDSSLSHFNTFSGHLLFPM
ncbi:uncharacterized protein LOC116223296 isoform X4 [Clupea harengus]|uniref:Uncharacterized protein LOC116223296 isoform X4 n=1 Tax=Clupea harengus TaxID=7950 RepID=A0A6P8GE06_CLUHA|nr:uncharacterized protein LOC116223296 isoform X4 [Clupea harengus]